MSAHDLPDSPWGGGCPVLADEAMDDWVGVVRACSPWRGMLLDDVTGEFRAILEELLERPDVGDPERRAARLRYAARAHGAFRRRQGCHANVLVDEVAFAEGVIVAALVRSGAPAAVVTTIQDSLAPVFRSVERAAYSGYVDGAERSRHDI